MEKHLQPLIKLVLLAIAMLFSACGDEYALSEKYYYLSESSKEWLLNDDQTRNTFTMIDDNGISHNYAPYTQKRDYDIGTSGLVFLPMPTRKSYRERYYISTSSNFNHRFSMYLNASAIADWGDDMHFSFQDISLQFNINKAEINYISTQQVSYYNPSDIENIRKYAKAEFVDNIEINGVIYKDVLKFEITDMKNKRSKYDIIAFYYAKGYGLIKYVYNSGLNVVRK
jgi:hypothetical protein